VANHLWAEQAPVTAEPIEVIVEIPQGSRNKYEYDHAAHVIRLDRVLYSSVHYPTDYGFIPETLSKDGDPLDVLVLVYDPTFPGCHVSARPIGVLRMVDDKGEDEKILAVPTVDPRFSYVNDLDDLDEHWLKEIQNFFATYKLLEETGTELLGWDGAPAAVSVIEEARRRHNSAVREDAAAH
jgi:inorganic pyrophosphatase